jgi:hypothetical protein
LLLALVQLRRMDRDQGMIVIRLIGVGTNENYVVRWQSPDLPAPTITTGPGKMGGAGWLLFENIEKISNRSCPTTPHTTAQIKKRKVARGGKRSSSS